MRGLFELEKMPDGMFSGEFRSKPYFDNRSIKFLGMPAAFLPTFAAGGKSRSEALGECAELTYQRSQCLNRPRYTILISISSHREA